MSYGGGVDTVWDRLKKEKSENELQEMFEGIECQRSVYLFGK